MIQVQSFKTNDVVEEDDCVEDDCEEDNCEEDVVDKLAFACLHLKHDDLERKFSNLHVSQIQSPDFIRIVYTHV